jgi:FkbM family methyltransferase
VYTREAAGLSDFLRLWQVRLSQSKIGFVVCPSPILTKVHLKSLGGRVYLRSHTTDISVLGEVVGAQSYAAAAAVLAADGEPATIIDLGGNTGIAARWLLGKFPTATLCSVEPEGGNYAMLERNLAGRATCLRACAGSVERTVRMSGSDEDGFRMVDDPNGDVRVMTIPTIINAVGTPDVDLLKVDIEGAEQELFDSCRPWIGRIRVLSVECHAGYSPDDLLEALRRNGARVDLLDRAGDISAHGYETVLLRRRGRNEQQESN